MHCLPIAHRGTNLHAIEGLAIPFLPPYFGGKSLSKLHKYHISVYATTPYHPKMTDFIPRLFAYKPKEIRRCEVGWDSENTQSCAIVRYAIRLFIIRHSE